jgi:hypothetical protein
VCNNHAITKCHAVPETTNDAVFSTSGRCWVVSSDSQVHTQFDARAHNTSGYRQCSSRRRCPCSITSLEVSSPLHTPILRSPSFRGGSGPVRPLQPSAARKQPPVSTQDLTHKPAIQDLKLFSPRRFKSITSRRQLCTIEFSRWPALSGTPNVTCNTCRTCGRTSFQKENMHAYDNLVSFPLPLLLPLHRIALHWSHNEANVTQLVCTVGECAEQLRDSGVSPSLVVQRCS